MNICVSNSQKDLKISIRSVKQVMRALLAYLKVHCSEIAIHFVTKKCISSLHMQFFDDPSPTDCISFPLDPLDRNEKTVFLGDIFVCPHAALDFVAKENGNVYEEVTLYMIHGLLHILGYDDLSTHERKKMRKEEKRLMQFLQKTVGFIVPSS